MYNQLKTLWEKNRSLLAFCLLAALIWGLTAHAYGFAHTNFVHDALSEFNADLFGNLWKIQLGRVFVPFYRAVVRTGLTLPWLIGMVSILWVGLAAFVTGKLFAIRSRVFLFMTAGIFLCNVTMTSQIATYLNDLDCNMLALLLSVLAVYLWEHCRRGFLWGMLPVCLSLGLYQSYISVTITFILILLIMKLLCGTRWKEILAAGVRSLGMLLGGGLLYLGAMKGIVALTDTRLQESGYNTLGSMSALTWESIQKSLTEGYGKTLEDLFDPQSAYSSAVVETIMVVLLVLCGAVFLIGLVKGAAGWTERVFAVLLLGLLPVGMDVAFVLTGGMSHDLMHFAFWLVYLLMLLLVWWFARFSTNQKLGRGLRLTAVGLIGVLLWGNVQMANMAYTRRDLECKANMVYFTRVLDRMDAVEEYVPGETPVCFVGKPADAQESIPGFEESEKITGLNQTFPLATASQLPYTAFFRYVLRVPASIVDDTVRDRMIEQDNIQAMPVFPAEDSVRMVGNTLVVKLGKTE